MRRQARERRYHADAVMASLAHADDAAADANARSAHVLEGSEPILIGAGRNDLAVELRRGVEIVIVVVETGALEARGLPRVEHAERRAGLEPERTDGLHHGADPIEIAVPGRAPGRPHAEPAGARSLGGAGLVHHRRDIHQFVGLDACVVMRALRAIGAVLRAAAGLDRQQGRNLHLPRIEALPVDALGVEDEVRKRQAEQRFYLGPSPILAHGAGETAGEVGSCRRERRLSADIHGATMAAATGKSKALTFDPTWTALNHAGRADLDVAELPGHSRQLAVEAHECLASLRPPEMKGVCEVHPAGRPAERFGDYRSIFKDHARQSGKGAE